MSGQPQSAVDIANATISALGIRLDQKKQIQKIKQRVSPTSSPLKKLKILEAVVHGAFSEMKRFK